MAYLEKSVPTTSAESFTIFSDTKARYPVNVQECVTIEKSKYEATNKPEKNNNKQEKYLPVVVTNQLINQATSNCVPSIAIVVIITSEEDFTSL